jgi:hypothetical protein
MNARIKLGLLSVGSVTLALCGRVTGGAGAWGEAIARGAIDDARARARRTLAVQACLRALDGLSGAERAAAVWELANELGGAPELACWPELTAPAVEA